MMIICLISFPLLTNADDRLKEAQYKLKEAGFDPVFVDGIMGNKTRNAIQQYQTANHLTVTGELNEETWQLLENKTQNNLISKKTDISETITEEKPTTPTVLTEEKKNIEPITNTTVNPIQSQVVSTTRAKPPISDIKTDKIPRTSKNKAVLRLSKQIIIDPKKYIPKYDDKTLLVGVNIPLGPDKAIKKWGRLMDYLSTNIEGYHFKLVPIFVDKLYDIKDSLDYLLSQPQMFVEFEQKENFRAVATLRNLRLGRALDVYGVTFFTRKDSPINTLEDLRGKTIGSLGTKKAWGGWTLGWYMLLKNGIDPYVDMTMKNFKKQPAAVMAVVKGKIDSAVVRSDVLERMAKAKKIDMSQLKLIHPNTKYADTYPFWLSSELYPEWMFSAAPNTDEIINRKIAALLLILDRNSPVAKSAKIDGWTIPSNYQGVHKVLKELKISPYENYGNISFADVLKKYWPIIAMGLALLMVLAISVIYFRKLSTKLATTNHNLVAVQGKLVQSEKMAGIGMMVAGITHEINTPLAFAKSNITLIKEESEENLELVKELYDSAKTLDEKHDNELAELLEEVDDYVSDSGMSEMIDYVIKGLDGVSKLVLSLKNYSRVDRAQSDVVDLHEGLDSTLLIANNAIKQIATVKKEYGELPHIECSPSQINQVVMNILMNGVHAIEEKEKSLNLAPGEHYDGQIIIKTWSKKDHVFLSITDNGSGMKKSTQKKIFEPMFTTKEVGKGMGMGMALTKQIIDQHGGSISVKSKEGEGTTFTIKLPVRQSEK